MTASASILDSYRAAVDDLMLELAAHVDHVTPDSLHKIERILTARLPDPEFADLLTGLPAGATDALANLIAEVESYRPEGRNAAEDLGALIRICLLAQIDALWWADAPPYQRDLDVFTAAELVDIDALPVRFRYRRQVTTFAGRVLRGVERRAMPQRTPRTAGLRFTHARPEVIALLDRLSADFATVTPAGTQRLPIVDREHAAQPWCSADGRWLLCYNGEVFNFADLRAELVALGRVFRSVSDTEVVMEAFLAWGEDAARRLRGEYAFAIVERATGRAYLARDPLGVKPLYWSRPGGHLHVASEIKALVPVGAPIGEVPPGHHGWAAADADPRLAPFVDLPQIGAGQTPIDDPREAAERVRDVTSRTRAGSRPISECATR